MNTHPITKIDDVQIKSSKGSQLWVIEIQDAGSSATVTYTFYKNPQRLFFTKNASNQLVVNVEEIADPLWRDVSQKPYFKADNAAGMNYVFSTASGQNGETIVYIKVGVLDVVCELSADLGADAPIPAYAILLADEGKTSSQYHHEVHVRPR